MTVDLNGIGDGEILERDHRLIPPGSLANNPYSAAGNLRQR
jgi:hypothetical protein